MKTYLLRLAQHALAAHKDAQATTERIRQAEHLRLALQTICTTLQLMDIDEASGFVDGSDYQHQLYGSLRKAREAVAEANMLVMHHVRLVRAGFVEGAKTEEVRS